MDDSDYKYTQICSTRTIQSDKKGFFNEFFDEVRCACKDNWLKERFGKLKTDEERVLSIFNDPEVCDPVLGVLEHVKPVYKQKDAKFSSQRRLQGEKAFIMQDYKQALTLLNQAVVRAPPKGKDLLIDSGLSLALAYWTRSAVLLELQDGKGALADLKLSISNGLDLKHNPEYYVRTAKAYALINENAKAKIALSLAEKFYYDNVIKIEKSREELANITPNVNNNEDLKLPALSGGENISLKNASVLIQLSESQERGRHITAKDRINTGDIILTERPVAACLLPSYFGSHCHHCFTQLVTVVCCPNCSGLAFCSENCMNDAVNSYHKYECEFQDLFLGSGMSILVHIALRIITQSKDVDEAISNASTLVANLCSHADLRPPEDFLRRTLMSAFLLRCLQKADFFGKRKSEAVNPIAKELKITAAILGLLQVLQFNAHEVYETVLSKDHKFDGAKPVYIGAAIYKTGSYFNHDCCPGLARYFIGTTLVLACTRPVQPGYPVSENYGPVFTKMTLKERQQSLKSRYWFKCTCNACTENWPTLQKLDQNVRFKCITTQCDNVLKYPKDASKDVRCAKCRKNISLKESIAAVITVEDMYREAANAMEAQDREKAIGVFKEAIDLFHQVAVLPHRDTHIAQESLRLCYADTGSKFSIVCKKENAK